MTHTDPRTSQTCHDTHERFAGAGPNTPGGHTATDTQRWGAAGRPSPQPTMNHAAPGGTPSAGDPDSGDQSSTDAQTGSVAALAPPAPAKGASALIARAPVLADPDEPGPARSHPPPNGTAPVLADPLLALAADVLDDLERVRVANENRLRQLTRDQTDKDGEERGFGLDVNHPDVARLKALVDALARAEHDAELNLRRQLRKHPLGPWVKQARGVGEKQAARLLAAIGDPYIRPEIVRTDGTVEPPRPRTVSELWAYTGFHVLPAGHSGCDGQGSSAGGNLTGGDPDQVSGDSQNQIVGVAATRRRNHKANWSATAKMRAHLVAVSIVKAGGPYRAVYDHTRAKYTAATHQTPCVRCGPTGTPAPTGSALSDGHKHARAVRAVAKAVLKDLWREARRLRLEIATPVVGSVSMKGGQE